MQAALSLNSSQRQLRQGQLRALSQLRASSQLRKILLHLSLPQQLPAPRARVQAEGGVEVEAGVGVGPQPARLLPLKMRHKVYGISPALSHTELLVQCNLLLGMTPSLEESDTCLLNQDWSARPVQWSDAYGLRPVIFHCDSKFCKVAPELASSCTLYTSIYVATWSLNMLSS